MFGINNSNYNDAEYDSYDELQMRNYTLTEKKNVYYQNTIYKICKFLKQKQIGLSYMTQI
jgi:hypothetical protein